MIVAVYLFVSFLLFFVLFLVPLIKPYYYFESQVSDH